MNTLEEIYNSSILEEGSFNKKDIPKKFYCVVKFPYREHEVLDEFKTGVLHGVQGISASPSIIYKFSGDEKAFFVMDGFETVKLNKLSKINYDNADYFVSNNIKNLRRMTNIQSIMNIFWTPVKDEVKLIDEWAYIAINDEDFIGKIEKKFLEIFNRTPKKIPQSVKTIVEWFKNEIFLGLREKSFDVTELNKRFDSNKIIENIKKFLKSEGDYFSNEKEWILKDQKLIIPSGSQLYVFGEPFGGLPDIRVMRAIKNYGLDKQYNAKFVDLNKFSSRNHTKEMNAKYKIMNITEGSFVSNEIPKRFFVSINLDNEKNAEELSVLKLKGVQGLSDSPENILQWFGVARNTLLIMNGQEVVKLNKLSKIMYNNPHYFLSNNMAGLFRMWDKKPDNFSGVMNNICDLLIVAMKHDPKYKYIGIEMEHEGFNPYFQYYSYGGIKINNIHQLSELLYKIISSNSEIWSNSPIKKITLDDIRKLVPKMLEHLGETYKTEGEWLLKDKILVIPPNSSLVTLIPQINKEIMDKYKNGTLTSLDKWNNNYAIEGYEKTYKFITEFGLEHKFNVKFLNSSKFDKGKSKFYQKKYPKKP